MLSLLPQILFLAPVGVALVRVAAGSAILYIGFVFFREREAVARVRLPIIGTRPVWLSTAGSFVYMLIGAAIVCGLWTQGAAILGALIALKSAVFAARYRSIIPLPLSTNLLLLAMLLSLVVTGAGALAFDLPL